MIATGRTVRAGVRELLVNISFFCSVCHPSFFLPCAHPSLPPGTQPTCTDLHCALRIRRRGRVMR